MFALVNITAPMFTKYEGGLSPLPPNTPKSMDKFAVHSSKGLGKRVMFVGDFFY